MGTAPVALDGVSLANQTLRMIAHVSLGGPQVRVRFSNAYGMRRLHVAATHVALRSSAAEIVPTSDRTLTVGGCESVDIPVGALVISDPVELEVPSLSDVAVSFYLPGEVPASFAITGHGNSHQTSYISTPGNFVAACDMPVQEPTAAYLFLNGIDVLAPDGAGSIVTLGDSLTDCNISKLDANNRWPDQLARRLLTRSNARPLGVINQGLGGNRILHDVRGDSGLRRFDRDVIAQPGVSHAIVLLGINDIRNRSQLAAETVSAEDLIGGLQQMIVRAHTRGINPDLGGQLQISGSVLTLVDPPELLPAPRPIVAVKLGPRVDGNPH